MSKKASKKAEVDADGEEIKVEKVEINYGPKVKTGENVFGVVHIYASFNDTFVVRIWGLPRRRLGASLARARRVAPIFMGLARDAALTPPFPSSLLVLVLVLDSVFGVPVPARDRHVGP